MNKETSDSALAVLNELVNMIHSDIIEHAHEVYNIHLSPLINEAKRLLDNQQQPLLRHEDPRLLQAIHILGLHKHYACPMQHGFSFECDVDICMKKYPDQHDIPESVKSACWLEFFNSNRDVPTCIYCGCTGDIACTGGCSWAHKHPEPPICSKCVSKSEDSNG